MSEDTPKKKPKPPFNLRYQIINRLRKLFWFHPGLKEVAKRTRVEKPKTKADGTPAKRPEVWHKCEGKCGKLHKLKDMRYDHIEPVVVDEFKDWNTYIARMFDVIPHGIQHLCIECHKEKTGAEAASRAAYRRAKKAG